MFLQPHIDTGVPNQQRDKDSYKPARLDAGSSEDLREATQLPD
jgi:hypothetical protein